MLEALAMGLAVFSTDVGDIDKVLQEFNAGITVNKDSTINQMSSRFRQFVINELSHHEINAKESSEEIRRRFSTEAITRKYESLFESMLIDNVN